MILSRPPFLFRPAILSLLAFCSTAVAGGTYPMLETSFQLAALHGNPFDYSQNDAQVVFYQANTPPISIPAFFDGGVTWRARFTPTLPGDYFVKCVTLNGQIIQPQQLNP